MNDNTGYEEGPKRKKERLETGSRTQVPDTAEQLTLQVPVSIKERRIDKYLHSRFSDFSRVAIQAIIKAGTVKVNGKVVKPSYKLSGGDKIDLTVPQLPSREIQPEDIPLDIIYEDSCLIVLNKQADMIVHPARGNTHGTLVNALSFYLGKQLNGDWLNEMTNHQSPAANHQLRPGIIHRLDKNTTGVMVVAKKPEAQWKIAKQFERRQVKKSYLAIVHGTPELTADRINAPLGIHPKAREKYAVRPPLLSSTRRRGGKEAITFYEVLESFRGFSLLKLTPRTGRTHQIRVHLSYIKHPIVADDMYGGKVVYLWQLKDTVRNAVRHPMEDSPGKPAVEQPIIDRPALHASTLEFKHPETSEIMKFEAPLPEDIQNLLDMLRKYRKV